MFNRYKKTDKPGRAPTKAQKQAWIENWTVGTLLGYNKVLTNVMQQATEHELEHHKMLSSIVETNEAVIHSIKKEQIERKVKKEN